MQAADKLARKFRDIALWAHERGRLAAELYPQQQVLDFERAVSDTEAHAARKGFAEGG